tara:strand:+ start:496 stop:1200 length:705 start_codon:yes stop_codon:yes gene_type:complete
MRSHYLRAAAGNAGEAEYYWTHRHASSTVAEGAYLGTEPAKNANNFSSNAPGWGHSANATDTLCIKVSADIYLDTIMTSTQNATALPTANWNIRILYWDLGTSQFENGLDLPNSTLLSSNRIHSYDQVGTIPYYNITTEAWSYWNTGDASNPAPMLQGGRYYAIGIDIRDTTSGVGAGVYNSYVTGMGKASSTTSWGTTINYFNYPANFNDSPVTNNYTGSSNGVLLWWKWRKP